MPAGWETVFRLLGLRGEAHAVLGQAAPVSLLSHLYLTPLLLLLLFCFFVAVSKYRATALSVPALTSETSARRARVHREVRQPQPRSIHLLDGSVEVDLA